MVGSRLTHQEDGSREKLRDAFILHSSGTTGVPKIVRFTHRRVILAMSSPIGGMTGLSSLPCYHGHGLLAPFMNWGKRKLIYLWDGKMPQTRETVTKALELSHPEAFYTVPYILKLLAEEQIGINLLKCCKMVAFSGSSCPDELGNELVNQGVYLGSLFGL